MPEWKRSAIRCTRAKNRNNVSNFNKGIQEMSIVSHKHHTDMWSSPIDCSIADKFDRDYANVNVHSSAWDEERCPRLYYLQEADVVCVIPPRKMHPRRIHCSW